MVKVVVVGCSGRMGLAVMEEVLLREGAELVGAVTRRGGESVGKKLACGLEVREDIEPCDVVIDFSLREGVREHSERAVALGAGYVCCVTGLWEEEERYLEEASKRIGVVRAPNTSKCVNVLRYLTERSSEILGSYDVDIVEYHHRHKKDAPSGTALLLGEAVARGRGVSHDEVRQEAYERSGKRRDGGIGYAVVRGGEIVGEHHVLFSGSRDRIELVHKSQDRGIYAEGAVDAAMWLASRGGTSGLYGMQDVLGL